VRCTHGISGRPVTDAHFRCALGGQNITVISPSPVSPSPTNPIAPPFKRGWPFLGSILDCARDPIQFFESITRSHGPIVNMMLGNRPMTLVTRPDLVARAGQCGRDRHEHILQPPTT
jgi:Cytochrome P450